MEANEMKCIHKESSEKCQNFNKSKKRISKITNEEAQKKTSDLFHTKFNRKHCFCLLL